MHWLPGITQHVAVTRAESNVVQLELYRESAQIKKSMKSMTYNTPRAQKFAALHRHAL